MLPEINCATRVMYDNRRSCGRPHKVAVDDLCIYTVNEIFRLLCMHCHITKLLKCLQQNRRLHSQTRTHLDFWASLAPVSLGSLWVCFANILEPSLGLSLGHPHPSSSLFPSPHPDSSTTPLFSLPHPPPHPAYSHLPPPDSPFFAPTSEAHKLRSRMCRMQSRSGAANTYVVT